MDLSSLSSHLKLHYDVETESLTQLHKLEHHFREHYALMVKEAQMQREVIERLWVLSQRYIMLMSTGPCCKFPFFVSPTEDIILQEYNEKLKLLRYSNNRIKQSLYALRKRVLNFQKLTAQLDMTVESPFVLGDTFHKPISFFIELVDDLFNYFHMKYCKWNCSAHQLDPADYSALEEYKAVLQHSEEFDEYLTVGLTYCKCLAQKPTC